MLIRGIRPGAPRAARQVRARLAIWRPPPGRLLASALLLVATWLSPAAPAAAQGTPAAPATYHANSPHWSHIRIWDYGGSVRDIASPSARQAAYAWYAGHVDVMGVPMDTFSFLAAENPLAYLKSLNPTLKVYGYDYDLTMCQSSACDDAQGPDPFQSALPEDQYLHFSEDTQVRFIARDGTTVVATVNIPGCPEPGPATSACRAQVYIWQAKRWIANVGNPAWQQWFAAHLLDEMAHDRNNVPNPVDGILLDEHGPGLAVPVSLGFQTVIVSGGGIREYGGLRPRDPSVVAAPDRLDSLFTTDVNAWFAYLHSQVAAVGKFAVINIAEYFMDPLAFTQTLALKGASTQLLHAGFNFRRGANQYQQFINQVQQMTGAGGVIDLAYAGCVTLPPGYTAGNYPTPLDRVQMWNLASYYMVKEFGADSGTVYFNPNLCVDYAAPRPLDFEAQWLGAFAQDVGQPMDRAAVLQQGPRGCGIQGYKIFVRHYTNAITLVRPRDDPGCTDYGDASAVPVLLAAPMQILQPDGTLSAPTTTVSLRNAEAAILFPASTPPAPAAIRDLHAW